MGYKNYFEEIWSLLYYWVINGNNILDNFKNVIRSRKYYFNYCIKL